MTNSSTRERNPSREFSWLRVGVTVAAFIAAFVLLWKYSPLSTWMETQLRLTFGHKPTPVSTQGEFDSKMWEHALQYWEPFEFDSREALRVSELGIASYVPRDNLANIEMRVTGRRPNRSEVLDGLRQLNAVLLRYPERFVRASGFERLVWLCEIVKDAAPVRGFALPAAKTLVLDPSAFDAGIFHHEMFHVVDYRLHGDPGDQPTWDALNPADAVYIGLAAYGEELRRGAGLGHADPMFITDYARAMPNEDRAETFRVLMTDPGLARERRETSAVIDAKARYIIAQLDELASGSSIALDLR
jgi:hypothetical protein